jgi:hypothetical protein
MEHGRRPALSPKSIAFMRAQLGHEPLATDDDLRQHTLLQRLMRMLTWFTVGAFILLGISAPIVLLLWLLSPYNLTITWLNCLCICVACLLLVFLPAAAHRAPWKTAVLAIVIILLANAAYIVVNVPYQIALADISLGFALGITAALEGYERTVPARWSPVQATLFAFVSMAGFINVGLTLSYYVLPHTHPYEPVIPRVILWGTFLLLSRYSFRMPNTAK